MREGFWFVDAQARTCIRHDFPAPERAYTFCARVAPHKVGDVWTSTGRRGTSTHTIAKGYVYPVYTLSEGAKPD